MEELTSLREDGGLQLEVGTQGGIGGGASAVVGYQHEFVCFGLWGWVADGFPGVPFCRVCQDGLRRWFAERGKSRGLRQREEGGEGGTGKDDAEAGWSRGL